MGRSSKSTSVTGTPLGAVLSRTTRSPVLQPKPTKLGELLEQAASAHELEDGPRREVWRQLADAAVQVATYAAILAGDEHAD